MTKRPALLAALAATILLAGCGTPNRGLESVHQPVVSRTDYVLDVQAGYDGLSGGEARRIDGWMEALHLGYGDTVALDDPYAVPPPVRADLAALVARRGLLLSGDAPVTGARVAPGAVRLVVSRARAFVPNCPDHSRTYQPNFNAHTSSDYGCATNSNLAAMIANPTDLVRGAAGAGDIPGNNGARAIATMRSAAPTGEGGGWLKGKAESAGGKK